MPVIVKAHAAHPETSALVGHAVRESVKACGLPEGVFSLLFDAGVEVGIQLVKHPAIKAVAFTGSLAGGIALMKLAAARPEPIPCYAEMGSVNPVFVLPGALKQRARAVATGLQASFTVSAGQLCTKPGLVLVPQQDGTPAFHEGVGRQGQRHPQQTLLTRAIADRFHLGGQGPRCPMPTFWQKEPRRIARTACRHRAGLPLCRGLQGPDGHEELAQEIFGPTTVVVGYQNREQLLAVAEQLEGHLAAALHADESELADYADLIDILTRKVGPPDPEWLSNRGRGLRRYGARGSFSRHQRWPLHLRRFAGYLPLHPPGLLPILSRRRPSRMSSRATTPSESCAWSTAKGHASPRLRPLPVRVTIARSL